MRYSTFITTVEQAAGITREDAELAVDATLRTLAERITRGEAEDIALFPPRELRPALTSAPEPAEAFDHAEFIRHVAMPTRVEREDAAALGQPSCRLGPLVRMTSQAVEQKHWRPAGAEITTRETDAVPLEEQPRGHTPD